MKKTNILFTAALMIAALGCGQRSSEKAEAEVSAISRQKTVSSQAILRDKIWVLSRNSR